MKKDYLVKASKRVKHSKLLRGLEWTIIALIVLFLVFCIVNTAKAVITKNDIKRCMKYQRYEQSFEGFELGSLERDFCENLNIIIK